MSEVMRYPFLVLVLSLVVLWLSAQIGAFFRKKRRNIEEHDSENFNLIVTAALTLLGLIIGFSFSMASSRYDQRKNYEEEKPMQSGQNMSGQTFCQLLKQRECVRC